MEITIREFNPQDKSDLILLMDMFNSYVQSVDDKHRTDFKPESSEYFTDKMIKLAAEKDGVVFVSCDGEKVIGFISGYIDTQDQDELMETIQAKPGVIGELFVTDEYRGQKIGKQLLEKMENYFKSKGCDIVRLAVFAPNSLARKFYEHAEYSERIIYVMKEL